MPSRNPFVCGSPQMKTTTLRMIHGSQARKVSEARPRGPRPGSPVGVGRLGRASFEGALADARASDTRQMFFGCQNFKNKESEAIETIAATTSTSHGP